MSTRPVAAICRWEYLLDKWTGDDDDAQACRASLGDKRLTVWLPRGARIVFRTSNRCFLSPFESNFRHYYGRGEKRILIRIVPLPGESI